MLIWERLAYLLILAPFFMSKLAAAGIILALVLLMRHTRRLNQKIDSLRKTMNEAIIHDLKNPLTAVIGCLSCSLIDEPTPEQRAKLLNIALHSCRAQMSLLDTLVDTSRLENGELVARRQILNPRLLFANCLEDIGTTAHNLGVHLESKVADDLPQALLADPDLLPRAIYNLLHNALKYSASGDTVFLAVTFHGEAFQFEIKDTGIGIAPEHINRLFKKYYRVEGSNQASRRGSGLGLYFCRLVVEAHGGRISVTSGVGRGTTILFTIPQSNGAGEPTHDSIEQTNGKPSAAV